MITSVRINFKGTHVSLLTNASIKGSKVPATFVRVYDIERDIVLSHNLEPNRVNLENVELTQIASVT